MTAELGVLQSAQHPHRGQVTVSFSDHFASHSRQLGAKTTQHRFGGSNIHSYQFNRLADSFTQLYRGRRITRRRHGFALIEQRHTLIEQPYGSRY